MLVPWFVMVGVLFVGGCTQKSVQAPGSPLSQMIVQSTAVDRVSEQVRTEVVDAARRGDPRNLAMMISASGADPNTKDSAGETLLNLAVKAGSPEAVGVLLQSGARAAVPGADGKTALDLARAANRSDIVALLEGRGPPVAAGAAPSSGPGSPADVGVPVEMEGGMGLPGPAASSSPLERPR